VALPILWLLFLYDLYWVYESDVMVTVAKSIELPLRLKFPYYNESNTLDFSILGLGDIILPGLLLSLCLKYDVDCCIHSENRPKTVQDFKLWLYYIALSAYTVSIISTYSAMYFFKHPQPALVFIVPICTLAIVAGNYALKRKYSIFKYNTAMLSLRGSPVI
jgi:minor histocompatibility antigen H13